MYRDKAKLNLMIDFLLFLVFIVMIGIGLLIKYVLVPGVERNAVYGETVDLLFWNMDRHQWGTMHFVFSLLFIVLLIVHILIHWKMIISIFKRLVPSGIARKIITLILVFATFVFIVVPLFLTPEMALKERHHFKQTKGEENLSVERQIEFQKIRKEKESLLHMEGPVLERRKGVGRNTKSLSGLENGKNNKNISVYGYMTLNDLAGKYDVPVFQLCKKLRVPHSMVNERIGRLKRSYHFEMRELKDYIITYHK